MKIEPIAAYNRHLCHALTYLESHQAELVRLDELADAIGISPSRLSHIFRDTFGFSYTSWRIRRCIYEAIALMHQQDLPVGEIARRSGFRSCRSFSRSFSKVTGSTPATYRKAYRAQILSEIRSELALRQPDTPQLKRYSTCATRSDSMNASETF